MNIYSPSNYPSGFYVYAYIRAGEKTPYYIGKGSKRRLIARHSGISVPKDHDKIVVLEENLTEIGAIALERRYIRWYGRVDIGTGVLRNRTDGGEGTSGIVRGSGTMFGKTHSQESKNKIKSSLSGRTLSKSHRTALSESKKTRWENLSEEEKQNHLNRLNSSRKNIIIRSRLYGEDNPQYGTKWITNGNQNRKIKNNEPLDFGWYYGRTVIRDEHRKDYNQKFIPKRTVRSKDSAVH